MNWPVGFEGDRDGRTVLAVRSGSDGESWTTAAGDHHRAGSDYECGGDIAIVVETSTADTSWT